MLMISSTIWTSRLSPPIVNAAMEPFTAKYLLRYRYSILGMHIGLQEKNDYLGASYIMYTWRVNKSLVV